jgi:hypothetical protein
VATLVQGATPKVKSAALTDAIGVNALVPDGQAWVPHHAVGSIDMPREWQPWLERGFRPVHCKPSPCTPDQRIRLDTVFERIGDGLALHCPPHWVVPGYVVSLHLPAAVDLSKAVDAGACERHVRRIHAVCLRSLARAVAHDDGFRAALRAAGLAAESFPVAQRFRRAVAILESLTGATGLPATLLDQAEAGRTALFWDPKPANFIVPYGLRRRWGDAPWPEPAKVDLDLMHAECPVALQVLLTLYAHPIVIFNGEGAEATFQRLHRTARTAAMEFGVDATEIDLMVLYHLARNVASSAVRPEAGHLAKFRAMAPLLAAAIRELPPAAAARSQARQLEALSAGGI